MGRRNALLIGVEDYGEGLANLPSAGRDVVLMAAALAKCGYDVEVVEVADASAESLDDRLTEFCQSTSRDDIGIIYFSGHGISLHGHDYLIPPGLSRAEAEANENKLITTDWTNVAVEGVVVFVIDACRDETVAKRVSEFGAESIGGPMFMRFFGCSQGQICQVVQTDRDEAASLFTKALAESLESRDHDTLSAVLSDTVERCRRLAVGTVRTQKPRISHGGETSPEALKVLARRIFNPPVSSSLWQGFDPSRMHCLLLTSEFESHADTRAGLSELVHEATKGLLGRRIWRRFREYADTLRLVSGDSRSIPEAFNEIRLAEVSVRDAFEDPVFADVVRGLVEADLVVFDVTNFEPGMMLLMGIRASAKRGLSLCTHGKGWRELDEIDVPFNLADLSIGSHTESEAAVGEDRVAEALVKRVETGFRQMARQPTYRDLPAYDALRRLGPRYDAASTVSAEDRVLVLASYEHNYRPNWKHLKNTLEGYLADRGMPSKVLRLVDAGNPQLVSQSLFEQIRRVAGCVADWTEFSPSTFFELGARLAVSEWGAVQMIDRRHLPGAERAQSGIMKQIERLVERFDPLVYDLEGDDEPFGTAASMLARAAPGLDRETKDNTSDGVHEIVSDAIQRVANDFELPHETLKSAADSIHHPDQEVRGAPQILFRHSSDRTSRTIKSGAERVAMEYRVASWLYLHHRLGAASRKPDDELRRLHDQLGNEAANALFDAGDVNFGDRVYLALADSEADEFQRARVQRKRGDAWRNAGDEEHAKEAFEAGVGLLGSCVAGLESRPRAEVAEQLADALGNLGGMLARIGDERRADALNAYQRGAQVEMQAGLSSTYNRLNAIKFGLRIGGQTLEESKPAILELADFIDDALRSNAQLADSGWAWADLADCRALLGDLAKARTAYTVFIDRAEIKSPQTALSSLDELAQALVDAGDPGAQDVGDAAHALMEEIS